MSKTIIYQVLPRLWGSGKFSQWDNKSLEYMKSLCVDYIWFTGIPRHSSAKDFVKGNPGSPYSITDWYDVSPYLADKADMRMQEFESMVQRIHAKGLKLMLDFIPNHVAPDYQGAAVKLDWHDGDWTDTAKLDYSDPRTEAELTKVLLYWAGKGVDGFRCDMVELVSADVLGRMIANVKRQFPDRLFVAEVYDKANYRPYLDDAGFDLLYDKSGIYDVLRGIYAGWTPAQALTWNWQFLGDMQGRMLNFLENHDESRVASKWFAGSAGRSMAAVGASLLFNEASFMMYFGQEVGEDAIEGHEGRTSIFDWCKPVELGELISYIETGKGLGRKGRSVLSRYRHFLALSARPVFRSGKVWDLCYCNGSANGFDAKRHFAFLRYNEREAYLVACNFSDEASSMTLNIPQELGSLSGLHAVEVASWDCSVVKLELGK